MPFQSLQHRQYLLSVPVYQGTALKHGKHFACCSMHCSSHQACQHAGFLVNAEQSHHELTLLLDLVYENQPSSVSQDMIVRRPTCLARTSLSLAFPERCAFPKAPSSLSESDSDSG